MDVIRYDSPTKIYLNYNWVEQNLTSLKRLLTYEDKKIQYQIQRLKKASWFDPEKQADQLQTLKDQQFQSLLLQDQDENYYTYAGLLPLICQHYNLPTPEPTFQYPKPSTLPWANLDNRTPYGYQMEIFQRLIQARHGAVSVATGLGKSLVILHLCKHLGLKTVVMAPSTNIADQLYLELSTHLGIKYVGKFYGGKKESKKKIVVAIGASLTRVEQGDAYWDNLRQTEVAIMDECFPCETGIFTDDGVHTIGKLTNDFFTGRPLPKILSYNEQTKEFEYNKILNAWKKPMKQMVQINFTSSSIKCSEDHKFLTPKGWRSAKDLNEGDSVLGYSKDNLLHRSGGLMLNDDQNQLCMGGYLGDASFDSTGNKARIKFIQGSDQKEFLLWKSWMFNRENSVERIDQNGYAQKKAYRFYTQTFIPKYHFDCPKREVPQKLIDDLDWRGIAVWYMDDGSLGKNNKSYSGTLHTQSFSDGSIDRLIMKLQSFGVDCHRCSFNRGDKKYSTIYIGAKRFLFFCNQIAPYMHNTLNYKLHPQTTAYSKYTWNNQYLKTSEFFVKSVDLLFSITHPPRNARLNFLYDLEIENNHNFVVSNNRNQTASSGLIAHNCHTLPANTLEKVCHGLLSASPYRFFLSATQFRQDGLDLLLKAITGPIVFEMTLKEGVDGGYLSKPIFTMFEVESPSSYSSKDPGKMAQRHFYQNPNIIETTAQLTNKFIRDGKQVLILIDEISQFQPINCKIQGKIAFAHGTLTPENKKSVPTAFHESDNHQLIQEFNQGKYDVLFGTSAVSTGSDLKANRVTINLVGGKSETAVMQGAIGRSCRLHSPIDKTTCQIIDFDTINVPMLHNHAKMRKEIYNAEYGPVRTIRL